MFLVTLVVLILMAVLLFFRQNHFWLPHPIGMIMSGVDIVIPDAAQKLADLRRYVIHRAVRVEIIQMGSVFIGKFGYALPRVAGWVIIALYQHFALVESETLFEKVFFSNHNEVGVRELRVILALFQVVPVDGALVEAHPPAVYAEAAACIHLDGIDSPITVTQIYVDADAVGGLAVGDVVFLREIFDVMNLHVQQQFQEPGTNLRDAHHLPKHERVRERQISELSAQPLSGFGIQLPPDGFQDDLFPVCAFL